MLKLVEKKGSMVSIRRCPLTAGQRVSRRYRRAQIRRAEYKKLKAIVPSISTRQKVSKVTVIEEAIKYIDELHRALYSRVPLLSDRNSIPPFLHMSPHSVVAHMLRATPSLTTPEIDSCSRQAPLAPHGSHQVPTSKLSGVRAGERLHRPIKTPSVAGSRFSTACSRSSSGIYISKQLSDARSSNYSETLPSGSNSDFNIIRGSNPVTAALTQHRYVPNISSLASALYSSRFTADRTLDSLN